MIELEPCEFRKIEPVLEDVEHTFIIDAVIAGTSPGRMWVDDGAAPTSALVSTVEGRYLLGRADNDAFNHSLGDLVTEAVSQEARPAGWAWLFLFCPCGEWETRLGALFDASTTVKLPREFYVLRQPRVDWADKIPPGFHMKRVDADLLAQTRLTNLKRIAGWARGNFGSIDAFLENGFGFCLVREDEIVSWCMADCAADGRCEIGIHTDQRFRRRGFATLAAAAAVDHGLSHGLREVGWHCQRHNAASSATARKVGFEKVSDYSEFRVCVNEADAWLVKGNLKLIEGDFDTAGQHYRKALGISEQQHPPDSRLLADYRDRTRYCYQAACALALAGHRGAAVEALQQAIETGTYIQGGY